MAQKKFFVSQAELQATYNDLLSTNKVAEFYSVSKKLVLNYMRRYGIETQQRATPEFRAEQIKELAMQGLDSKAIAEMLNINLSLVNKYARDFDIVLQRYHKGFTKTQAGYIKVYLPGHKNASKSGYVNEHVLLITEEIGRPLEADEVVHHIDGDKSNNELSNLRLMTKFEHKSYHAQQPRKSKCQRRIEDIV